MTEKTAVGTTQVFGKDFSNNNSGFRLEGAQTSFQRLADETESSCRCQDSPGGGGGGGMPRLRHSNDPSKQLPRYNTLPERPSVDSIATRYSIYTRSCAIYLAVLWYLGFQSQ